MACYGTSYRVEKREFWEELQILVEQLQGPWLIYGDLNEVIDKIEKWGGAPFDCRHLYLKDFMQLVRTIDLRFTRSR